MLAEVTVPFDHREFETWQIAATVAKMQDSGMLAVAGGDFRGVH